MTLSSPRIYDYAFLFIYALCCMRFFDYVGFNFTYIKIISLIIQPLMVVLCFDQLLKRVSHPLYRYMQWILLSLLVSFVSAGIFWGQGLTLSYRAATSMFTLLFFFYICRKRPPISVIENFVLFWGILNCVLWLYAFSQLPYMIFGESEDGLVGENIISRGIVRISVAGKSFVVMSLFLSINKFYTTHKRYFLAFVAVFSLFIVLAVIRQVIVCSALVVAGYVYFRNKTLSIAVVTILIVFLAFGGSVKFSDNSIADSLITLTEDQIEHNEVDEDTRITEYRYFFGEYSKNIITSLIGNGMPHTLSSYGRYYDKVRLSDGLFMSDVGYAMMYVVTGWLGLALYLLLFFRSALTKVPDKLSYARMFMIYMIPANIAASWYAMPDYQICMAVSVYILMMYGQDRKKKCELL